MMGETIEERGRHLGVAEDPGPFEPASNLEGEDSAISSTAQRSGQDTAYTNCGRSADRAGVIFLSFTSMIHSLFYVRPLPSNDF